MSLSRLRLGLAILLFGLWMGWLIHLALTASHPIVLSRPQFLVSSLDVAAHIDSLNGPIRITDVVWPAPDRSKWLGKEVTVVNVKECSESWKGPGDYLLPLMPGPGGTMQVVPVPVSPGSRGAEGRMPVWIYPDTPETRRQLQEIRKPTAS